MLQLFIYVNLQVSLMQTVMAGDICQLLLLCICCIGGTCYFCNCVPSCRLFTDFDAEVPKYLTAYL